MRVILTIIIAAVAAAAQLGTTTPIRFGATLPATCSATTGNAFFKTTSPVGLHICTSANTWALTVDAAQAQTITGDKTLTGATLVKSLNERLYVDQFAGADAGAKINACNTAAIALATGATCDASALDGTQAITSTVTIGDVTGPKTVTLILPTGNYQCTNTGAMPCINVFRGSRIVGSSTKGTIISSGDTTARTLIRPDITAGNPGEGGIYIGHLTLQMRNATDIALDATAFTESVMENVVIDTVGGATVGTALSFPATSANRNYRNRFSHVTVVNAVNALKMESHGATQNAPDANLFEGLSVQGCATPSCAVSIDIAQYVSGTVFIGARVERSGAVAGTTAVVNAGDGTTFINPYIEPWENGINNTSTATNLTVVNPVWGVTTNPIIGAGTVSLYSSTSTGVGTGTPNIGGYTAPSLTLQSAGDTGLELVSSRADADGVAVGYLPFRGTLMGGELGVIQTSSQGATASNRGGQILFRTKADAGALATRWTMNNVGALLAAAAGTDICATGTRCDVFGATIDSTTLTEGGNAVPNSTDHLGFFAATTSAQLLGVISDETGSGLAVFGTSPTLSGTPVIGDGAGNDKLSFTEEATNPTCAAGDYFVWANSADLVLKKCQNGTISDLDTGGSGGDSVTINASATTDVNLNDTLPAAAGSGVNVKWQLDTATAPDNVSAYVQEASATVGGIVTTGTQTVAGNKTINGTLVLTAGFTSGGDVNLPAANGIVWSGRSIIDSLANGNLRITNNAGNDFGRLQFGGISSSFPALKRSTTELHVRLSDDSAYANIDAAIVKTGGTERISATGGVTNVSLDAEGTGNVITIPQKAWFTAAGCDNATAASGFDLPTTLAPAKTCFGTSPHRFGALDFADGASVLTATTNIHLPSDWSGAVDIKSVWFCSAGTCSTNNFVWTLATACIADTEDFAAPTYNTRQEFTKAGSATTNARLSDIQTGITTTGCAAGETLFLRIGRDPTLAGDTQAGTMALVGFELTFRRAI